MKIQAEKQIKQVVRTVSSGKVGTMINDFRKVFAEIRSKGSKSQVENPLPIDKKKVTDPRLDNTRALDRLTAGSFTASLSSTEGNTIKKVDHLLDLLESYSEALADPKRNLRDIVPLVTMLEREQKNLTEGETVLAGEQELNDLVTRTLILTQVEVAKFNRGDYL